MCEPISIGIAIGATTGAIGAAATGGDILQGALMGGVVGGFTGGMGGLAPGGMASTLGTSMGGAGLIPTVGILGSGVSTAAVMGATTIGLAGSIGMGMLMPQQQDYNQNLTGMPYTPQAYNTQHTKVTGSGGRQAAAVLASEIKQAKKLRQRQAGAEDYGLGMDMAGTGLQLA